MTLKVKRRSVLKGMAASAAVIGFPSVVRGARMFEGRTLSVFSYAGPFEAAIKTHMLKPFEEATGARVKMDVGWWDMLPRLKASPPGNPVYDVVITDPTQGFPSIREGLFAEFEPKNIPHAQAIYGPLQENWVQKERWGVNLGSAFMTLAFNTEMTENVPQHWHDLLKPEYAGNVSLYDALYQSLFAFAQIKAGEEGNPGGGRAELENNLDDVLRYAKDHRDLVRVWWSSAGDFIAKLLQKEVMGGVVHSAPAFIAEDAGEPVKAVVPTEGTAAVHLFWSVIEGTKEKELAEEWINHFFAPDFQAKFGAEGKQPVVNLEAAKMAGEINEFYQRYFPTSKEDWDQISYYPYDIYFEGDNWAKINDFWDREVLRTS